MKKVLIVDDSIFIRQLIREILLSEGFSVEEASNGLEALEKIYLKKPHLIISDVEMPIMNGIELAKEKPSSLPIILMSGNASLKGSSLADYFLPKPFDITHLLSIVKKIL